MAESHECKGSDGLLIFISLAGLSLSTERIACCVLLPKVFGENSAGYRSRHHSYGHESYVFGQLSCSKKFHVESAVRILGTCAMFGLNEEGM